MSGQIHVDFLRLLWVRADKQMQSYYESKEDKIRNEAFQWAKANVFNSNKTSVGRGIVFGCATRCHLSVHSLAMPSSGPGDASRGGVNASPLPGTGMGCPYHFEGIPNEHLLLWIGGRTVGLT